VHYKPVLLPLCAAVFITLCAISCITATVCCYVHNTVHYKPVLLPLCAAVFITLCTINLYYCHCVLLCS